MSDAAATAGHARARLLIGSLCRDWLLPRRRQVLGKLGLTAMLAWCTGLDPVISKLSFDSLNGRQREAMPCGLAGLAGIVAVMAARAVIMHVTRQECSVAERIPTKVGEVTSLSNQNLSSARLIELDRLEAFARLVRAQAFEPEATAAA